MPSLEERLNRLKQEKGRREMILAAVRSGQVPGVSSASQHFENAPAPQRKRADGSERLAAALPAGEFVEVEGCRVFRHRAVVPLDGTAEPSGLPWTFPPLDPEVLEDRALLAAVHPALDFEGFDPARIAFFDTETTGLAGGAGTCAFLVGAGWFLRDASGRLNAFEVEQWLIEDFCHESGMLQLVEERLSRFDAIASYNGKRFDAPLLRTRGVLNRKPLRFLSRPHVDLLYLSRRLWRERLGSASLGSIEQGVLDLVRAQDIPGALAPVVWEEFARTGEPGRLPLVVHHNGQDIVSLGALIARQACAWRGGSQPHELTCPFEARGLARLFERRREWPRARALYSRALELLRGGEGHGATAASLARLCRRMGNHDEAAEIWRELSRGTGAHATQATIELAKHLEHRRRDPQAALALVHAALHQAELEEEIRSLTGRGSVGLSSRHLDDLRHRRERLARKAERLHSVPEENSVPE